MFRRVLAAAVLSTVAALPLTAATASAAPVTKSPVEKTIGWDSSGTGASTNRIDWD